MGFVYGVNMHKKIANETSWHAAGVCIANLHAEKSYF